MARLNLMSDESVTAQPGRDTDPINLANWFLGETAAARVLNEVRKYCLSQFYRFEA